MWTFTINTETKTYLDSCEYVTKCDKTSAKYLSCHLWFISNYGALVTTNMMNFIIPTLLTLAAVADAMKGKKKSKLGDNSL